jgi:hypothetical protein
MTIQQIKAAAEIAKSRTNDKRWINAIDKAVEGFDKWIITELANCLAITTESGNTYFANGVCQCEAYKRSTACKHRALYRLYAIANELSAAEEAARRCDVIIEQIDAIAETLATTCDKPATRNEIIAEINATWPAGFNLADELMRRFRVNSLSFLADDMLAGILAAI